MGNIIKLSLLILTKQHLTRIVFLLFSFSIYACENVDEPIANNKNVHAVIIYKGLSLGGLLNKPVNIISTDNALTALDKEWYAGIAVNSNKGKAADVVIKSCSDYFKTFESHLEPVKEFERSAYFEFAVMCMAAKDIASSKSSSISYLSDFEFNIEIPKHLPKQFSFLISSLENKKMLNNNELVYWSDVVAVSGIDSATPESAVFKFDGSQQELSLVARADFNDDKIEDLLIISKDSVVGGSYTAIRLFLISKLTSEGEYILLNESTF